MNEIFTTIRRTPYQSFASFFSLSLALFLSTGIFLLVCVVYGLLGYVESLPQVTAYFQTQVKEENISQIREELLKSGKIAQVKYVSKSDAYQIYKQLNKDNPLLLEMVSSDILPASLEIYAKKPEFLPEIKSFIDKQAGIDEVVYQKNIVDRLLAITSIIKKTSFVFLAFLILSTMIILITITHFKIALKKDEIELLRLLGATPWYILRPFIKEGLFFGITSALIICSFFIGSIFLFQSSIASYLSGMKQLSFEIPFMTLVIWPLNFLFIGITYALSILFGTVISSVSIYFASRKYIS